jgi:hypothetical protein
MAEQRRPKRLPSERGMASSEFAVATIGSRGLASVLIAASFVFEAFRLDILELALSRARRGVMW